MPLKDFYLVRPDELERGDTLVTVVKALIDYEGNIRLYRSPWTAPAEPQGQRLLPAPDDRFIIQRTAYALFPVLINAPVISDASAICNWFQTAAGWMTDCGRTYPAQLKSDDPFDENFLHCPGCGRPISTDKQDFI